MEQETSQEPGSAFKSSGKLMRAVTMTTIERPTRALREPDVPFLGKQESIGDLMRRYSGEHHCLTDYPSAAAVFMAQHIPRTISQSTAWHAVPSPTTLDTSASNRIKVTLPPCLMVICPRAALACCAVSAEAKGDDAHTAIPGINRLPC